MSHYENFHSIKTIDDIKKIFPDGEADDMNWCVFSTSGVHGTYTTLDEIERYFADPDKFINEENGGEIYSPDLTTLVIRPRLVSMLYGQITVSKEDIPFIKKLIVSSLQAITQTQLRNLL